MAASGSAASQQLTAVFQELDYLDDGYQVRTKKVEVEISGGFGQYLLGFPFPFSVAAKALFYGVLV